MATNIETVLDVRWRAVTFWESTDKTYAAIEVVTEAVKGKTILITGGRVSHCGEVIRHIVDLHNDHLDACDREKRQSSALREVQT